MDDLTGIKLELVARYLRSDRTVKVRASGFSMRPFIRNGDLLTLKGIADAPLQPGAMVAFIRNDLLFIHRIIESSRTDGMVLTKGDNLLISDKLLRPEEILGVVVAVNDTLVTKRKFIHLLFFNLYRFCLLAGNGKGVQQGCRIIRLEVAPARFRISMAVLGVYRFFIFT